MTRCVFGFLLALSSAAASAQWTAVGSGNYIHTPYADRSTIRRAGSMVHMSGMYNFRRQDFTPEGKGVYSTVVLREYDCDGRRVRLLSAIDFSGHMATGSAVSSSARTGRWESIVAESLDEAYWNIACGTK